MAKLDLIKSGEFKELSAQVFEQTLGGGGTYTAVLAEKEELALAEAVCLADARAIRFAKKYWEHYCPFNSAVSLMLEHIKCQAVADILLFIINF